MSPVMEKAQNNAVTEAKEKAREEVLARLTIEREAQIGTCMSYYSTAAKIVALHTNST